MIPAPHREQTPRARVFLQPAFAAAALALVVAAALVAYALPFHRYLDFHPLNGAFQTFNPTRRLLDGQPFDAGFQSYLGVGVALMHAALTALGGGDFAASQTMARLLPPLVVLGCIGGVLWLARVPAALALALLAAAALLVVEMLMRVGVTPWGPALPDALRDLIEPGTSALSSRLALPILTLAAMSALSRRRDRDRVLGASAFGAVSGLQPFWSNDYGFGSFACLVVAFAVSGIRSERPAARALAAWLAALLASFAAACIVAGGFGWIDYNLRGVARDQLWYFGDAAGFVRRVVDNPAPPFAWVYALACAWLLWRAMNAPRRDPRHALLFYLATTPLAAALVASVGGHPDARYFTPIAVLLPFVLLAVGIDAARAWRAAHAADAIDDALRTRGYAMRFVAIAPALLAALSAPDLAKAYRRHFQPRPGYFAEPVLGGEMQDIYAPLIGLAHEIREHTQSLAPQRRVLSTYASALDAVVGSYNASGQDYVIHALGERQREAFVAGLRASAPPYVTAVNDRFTDLAIWQWDANWWFFRALLLAYRPRYETTTHVVFEPVTGIATPAAIACTIEREASNALVVRTSPLPAGARAPALIDVALSYGVSRAPTAITGVGAALRHRVRVEEIGGRAPVRTNGIPPAAIDWPVLVTDRDGTGGAIRVVVNPVREWSLHVDACKARLYGAADDLQRGRELVTTAANHTDANWDRGVYRRGDVQGILVRDRSEIAALVPGDRVEFASGSRVVQRSDNDRLWVEGAPLDPGVDGFPSLVRWPRAQRPAQLR